jgi:hypothetical protein
MFISFPYHTVHHVILSTLYSGLPSPSPAAHEQAVGTQYAWLLPHLTQADSYPGYERRVCRAFGGLGHKR